jgi:hypothetical protein
MILPIDYFDKGESLCLSVRLFNTECLGCGLTRAIMHLLHFDFETAWNYNKLSVFILPLLMMFWLYVLGKLINKRIFSFIDSWY